MLATPWATATTTTTNSYSIATACGKSDSDKHASEMERSNKEQQSYNNQARIKQATRKDMHAKCSTHYHGRHGLH